MLIPSPPLPPPVGDLILHLVSKIDAIRWKQSHLPTKPINPLMSVHIAFSSLRVSLPIRDDISTLSYPICLPNYPLFCCNIISLYWIISICLKTWHDIVHPKIIYIYFFPLTSHPSPNIVPFFCSPIVNLFRRFVNIHCFHFSRFPFSAQFTLSFSLHHSTEARPMKVTNILHLAKTNS